MAGRPTGLTAAAGAPPSWRGAVCPRTRWTRPTRSALPVLSPLRPLAIRSAPLRSALWHHRHV